MLKRLLMSAVLAVFLLPVAASANDSASKALFIVHSGDTQTQGMAMVLAGAMQGQGAEISMLLCDAAGDITVKGYAGEKLQPFNATPTERLQGLIANGATVELCALYIPNSGHAPEDIMDGVNPRAQPPQIAAKMLRNDVKVFSF
jgi:predicted peroxiredoxin